MAEPSVGAGAEVVICADFGSTFTKTGLVELATGRIVAAASHPTTIDTDVLDGFDACREQLVALDPRAADAEVLACSSAGGGLRIAVIGNEELVTAEAGRRVALSSGGKVVAVLAASRGDSIDLTLSAPDVVLLVGGTDGGNAEPVLRSASDLRESGWTGPVVYAGNARAAEEVGVILGDLPVVLADNVVPRIGVLAPESARSAIREMFLRHVIGGKHLSARADFTAMVRGATPDVVLTGVELLARGLDATRPGVGDVVVVDVGGATTDVHSVVELDPEEATLSREVVATSAVTRTVEGDLGMRWSAASTVAAAAGQAEDLGVDLSPYAEAAARLHDHPDALPADDAEADRDEAIAQAAVGLALRRHAGRARVVVSPEGRVVERTGKDLRQISLLVGSGGILRNGRQGVVERVFAGSTGAQHPGGWQLPQAPRLVVDREYVLAAAGLLAERAPEAAHLLVSSLSR